MDPPRIHLESPQTAVPTRAVEPPGRTRRVAVAAPPLPAAALQRRTRVVLYYRAGSNDGSPAARLWEEAVWAKESLSEAVADHPEMAGRLRRRADGSSWEVKLNDAGVRFTEATADATLDEFLAAVVRGGKEDEQQQARGWEAALAPWADVDAEDPDVSALVYVQLTRFRGDGGFAVGISCSLMLCDPVSLARFLASWAGTHAAMKADVATHPMMQYASYFRNPGARAVRALVKSIPLDDFASAGAAAETVLFRARPTTTTGVAAAGGAPDDHHALAVACVAQARERLGAAGKVPSQLPVVIFHRDDDGEVGVSVETCAAAANGGQTTSGGGGGRYELEVARWQELGLEELVFRDSKPLHVSCSILSAGCDGLAVLMPDADGAAGEFLVAATVPM